MMKRNPKIVHWNTWKKKNKPKMKYMVNDLSWGTTESIMPTLKSYGFIYTHDEVSLDFTIREQVENMLPEKAIEAVYHVAYGRLKESRWIEFFYKTEP